MNLSPDWQPRRSRAGFQLTQRNANAACRVSRRVVNRPWSEKITIG
jgi:hypothetical protein